jgi:hypothetical protein
MVTYTDFRGCTERLTDEVDRLTTQTGAASAVLEKSARYTEHVETVGRRIAHQIQKAEAAWSKADEIAAQAALRAHSAAFNGVEDSMRSVLTTLSSAAQKNDAAAAEVNLSARQARRSVFYLSAAFVVIAALGVLAILYVGQGIKAGLEAEMRSNAELFDLLWSKANSEEQKKIVAILQRQPQAATKQ